MKNKGITLIALVVTIVVLLILAGVSITAVFGEGGIIALAQEVANKTKDAEEKTIQDLNDLVNNVDKLLESEAEDLTTVKEAKESKTSFIETTKITDGEDTMWVPEKFTVIEGEKINDGVVVQDPDKNEFVWVPVKTIGNMVYCYDHPESAINYNEAEDELECSQCKNENKEATKFAGKLHATDISTGNNFDEIKTQTGYNKNNPSYNGIREPDVIIGNGEEYDALADNLKIILEEYTSASDANTLKAQLQIEFNRMAKSVAKYKGFYVGRYETSGLSNSGTTYGEISKGKVLKEQTSTSNATWYRQYVINKKIGSNYKDVAKTSMIWGCQWDQVMIWMKDVSNTKDATKKYIKDSTEMGNYAKTQEGETKIIPTGTNENYAIKNIYDMAGNLYEMTIEGSGMSVRSFRGGQYTSSSSAEPASYRTSYSPDSDYGKWSGSRSILYII